MKNTTPFRSVVAFTLFGALLLAGCQTWEQAEAQRHDELTRTLNSYAGTSVDVFVQEQRDFRPLNYYDENGSRVFVFENDPTYVTMHAPAFTPAPRTFNDSNMAAASANLGAAFGTVPAVSQTHVSVCRLNVRARPTGAGSGSSSWIIQSIRSQGHGC